MLCTSRKYSAMVRAERRDPEATPGRVAHLAEEEDGVCQDACLLHLVPEVVPLAGALAHSGEDGDPRVIVVHAANEFLEEDRLANARPADQAGLAALGQRSQKVDDLDPGFQELDAAPLGAERGSGTVNRPALPVG